jgi:predicted RNase H-like HicB family nuclease
MMRITTKKNRCARGFLRHNQENQIMKTNIEIPNYSLRVDWSEEDQIWIGTCPELFGGGVHGNDRAAVFAELRQVVDEVIEDAMQTGVPFPAALETPVSHGS